MSEASNDAINAIQRDHRACVRCVGAGYLPRAHPVFSGHPGQRLMLVGQAPGPVEDDVTRPFAGRAGMQLMRWFAQAGFAGEHEVRERVFMTSMTTCFPGRLPNNAGDRRPTATEVALCRGWLDAYLELLHPALIICIGGLAHSRFLPGRRLDSVVGSAWSTEGEVVAGIPARSPVLLPLPHPSGQSRWLNDPQHMRLLDAALGRLRQLAGWAASTST
ncbi:MAG: uracil-DNA glycosylase [Candidatus Dormibacteraeota bacterium]|uniref:Uracil-DNA glycosylase n=3 Tax=Candidatus Aeolococcus gillhamiae TaxID=3127015 RepID=A0A934N3Y3_9BACT|nr:uracil-DNA glycosylase [Candidatus Dormibacteraeota bacterium]